MTTQFMNTYEKDNGNTQKNEQRQHRTCETQQEQHNDNQLKGTCARNKLSHAAMI